MYLVRVIGVPRAVFGCRAGRPAPRVKLDVPDQRHVGMQHHPAIVVLRRPLSCSGNK